MMSRRLPPWKRWIGTATAALMLILSLGPSVALAASALTEGVIEADSAIEQEPQEQQEQLTIGVIDLEANGVGESEAKAITERFRTYLGRTGVFQVIERNRMEEIMVEMGFQASGACNTDECVVQVGQVLGASKMVAGSVSKVGTLYSLQIRMIDMATSRIEHPLFEDVDGIEEVLRTVTQSLANQLANLVRQQLGVPFQGEQPGGEAEQPETQRTRKRFPWWLLLLGAVGGGSAYLLSGDDPGPGGNGSDTIGSPPNRPGIPPR